MDRSELVAKKIYLIVYIDGLILKNDNYKIGAARELEEIEAIRKKRASYFDLLPVHKLYIKILRG